jgi:hypothetical protein
VASGASQGRLDASKALFLARLLKSWEKVPDVRMGALISDALTHQGLLTTSHLELISDQELIEAIERYVLLGFIPRHND